MNIHLYLEVAPHINDCPKCGNQYVGNGQGTLSVNDDIIERTCKCGFKFSYDVKNGITRAKIKKAVSQALSEMTE